MTDTDVPAKFTTDFLCLRWLNCFRVRTYQIIKSIANVTVMVWGMILPRYLFTPPQNRGGVIFLLQFVCVSVCVCLSVCLCVRRFLWTKFQPNGWTTLGAFFAKWLLTALAQTLLKLMTVLVKGQGHSDVIPIFLHNSLLTS